jgi:hypothetical protein
MPATVRRSVKVEGVEKGSCCPACSCRGSQRDALVSLWDTPLLTPSTSTRTYRNTILQDRRSSLSSLPGSMAGDGSDRSGYPEEDGTMLDAETAAAQFLLEMSKPLVPVDTGRLKASGFVEVEAVE